MNSVSDAWRAFPAVTPHDVDDAVTALWTYENAGKWPWVDGYDVDELHHYVTAVLWIFGSLGVEVLPTRPRPPSRKRVFAREAERFGPDLRKLADD